MNGFAMGEEQIKSIIAESLAEGGSILAAIKEQIKNALKEEGDIQQAIEATVSSAVSEVRQELDRDASADIEFPFRKILRGMNCAEYVATWRSMMVDPDHIQSLSDGIADGSMVTILALQAAHPENSDLLALKRHAALRHAPKVTWKSLVLPFHGGSSDRPHGHPGKSPHPSRVVVRFFINRFQVDTIVFSIVPPASQ